MQNCQQNRLNSYTSYFFEDFVWRKGLLFAWTRKLYAKYHIWSYLVLGRHTFSLDFEREEEQAKTATNQVQNRTNLFF